MNRVQRIPIEFAFQLFLTVILGFLSLLAAFFFLVLLLLGGSYLSVGTGSIDIVGEIFPDSTSSFAYMLVVSVWMFFVVLYFRFSRGKKDENTKEGKI